MKFLYCNFFIFSMVLKIREILIVHIIDAGKLLEQSPTTRYDLPTLIPITHCIPQRLFFFFKYLIAIHHKICCKLSNWHCLLYKLQWG